MQWALGEKRYVYVVISSSSGEDFTIGSASYEILDTEDESIVVSGVAGISSNTIYCLWQPSEVGVYVAQFTYTISLEDFKSSQVIEVKETM